MYVVSTSYNVSVFTTDGVYVHLHLVSMVMRKVNLIFQCICVLIKIVYICNRHLNRRVQCF